VADELRKEPDLKVELVNGNPGEFTVLMDGRVVAEKKNDALPPVEGVVAAVRKAETSAAGART
jgi:hypothetical protein